MNLEEIMFQLNLEMITPLGQIADDSHLEDPELESPA